MHPLSGKWPVKIEPTTPRQLPGTLLHKGAQTEQEAPGAGRKGQRSPKGAVALTKWQRRAGLSLSNFQPALFLSTLGEQKQEFLNMITLALIWGKGTGLVLLRSTAALS